MKNSDTIKILQNYKNKYVKFARNIIQINYLDIN